MYKCTTWKYILQFIITIVFYRIRRCIILLIMRVYGIIPRSGVGTFNKKLVIILYFDLSMYDNNYRSVKSEFNDHYIRKTILTINGLSAYITMWYCFFFFIRYLTIYKVIYFTYSIILGWYNFFRQYYISFIINI